MADEMEQGAEKQEEQAHAEPFVLKPRPEAAPAAETKKTAAGRSGTGKEEGFTSPFSVTVGQVYDGPMDLLLDLIRKQNLDIYDIPMGRITAQFLEYCHHLKNTDVDAAGEFVYTASLLIHIKSKMLLPRDPTALAGARIEDPRRELVERLLEHERFKAAAQMLAQKQQVEDATWSNPGMREFKDDAAGGAGDCGGYGGSGAGVSGHTGADAGAAGAECG